MNFNAPLPPPPPGLRGWPWQVESKIEQVPATEPWPAISLVTPSFNQGKYIEATLRSIFLQNYPNLELFVIDGGSTDETLSILKKYEPYLSGWVSEKDRGQSDAINKGLARCTGEVFNWINSDDQLTPGALWTVARKWKEAQPDLLAGACRTIEAGSGKCIREWQPTLPSSVEDFFGSGAIAVAQPATFIRTRVLRDLGGVREDLHCVMDWELYLRYCLQTQRPRNAVVKDVLATALLHEEAKTQQQSERFRSEAVRILKEIEPKVSHESRPKLLHWRRFLEIQDVVTSALATRRRWNLLKVPFKLPAAAASRFYWGAVLRAAGLKRS
jgi:glycosyltransferase involved in cell wall biosynthesis